MILLESAPVPLQSHPAPWRPHPDRLDEPGRKCEGRHRGHIPVNQEGVVAMGRIQIVRRPAPPTGPPPLDLRTPSGRPLPY
ncbi:hypothetical protein GCM10010447_57790 [Streptomyces fulvorobeus]